MCLPLAIFEASQPREHKTDILRPAADADAGDGNHAVYFQLLEVDLLDDLHDVLLVFECRTGRRLHDGDEVAFVFRWHECAWYRTVDPPRRTKRQHEYQRHRPFPAERAPDGSDVHI